VSYLPSRRDSSRSTASRSRSVRLSPSRNTASMRSNVRSGKRPGILSKLTCLRPTRGAVAGISFFVKPVTFLISPIALETDISYLVDISYGDKP